MKKNTSAFTLLEIMVASMILSIGVFGIYKMMSSNILLLSDWNNKQEAKRLFLPFEKCLENLGYESLSGSYNEGDNFGIHFGNDNMSCGTGPTWSQDNMLSGVLIGNSTYFLTAEMIEKNNEKITLNTNVFSEIYGNISQTGEIIEIIKN